MISEEKVKELLDGEIEHLDTCMERLNVGVPDLMSLMEFKEAFEMVELLKTILGREHHLHGFFLAGEK